MTSRNLLIAAIVLVIGAGLCALVVLRPGPPDRPPVRPPPTLPAAVTIHHDLVYAQVDGRDLRLDLYLPTETAGPWPVVVWIHGGGWSRGSKDPCPAVPLTRYGYAVASVSYRLAPEFTWPAQVQDCRAAVRFLRANAERLGLDGGRIGAWGISAGGHLAALLGAMGDDAPLGLTGGNQTLSSRVQAVCDWCGPTLLAELPDPPGWPTNPAVLLLGGPVADNQDKAAQACPITHASRDDPPLLIMHGDADDIVPLSHSQALHEAMRAAGAQSQLEVLPGTRHGTGAFTRPQATERVRRFFDVHLKAAPAAPTQPAGSQPASARLSSPKSAPAN